MSNNTNDFQPECLENLGWNLFFQKLKTLAGIYFFRSTSRLWKSLIRCPLELFPRPGALFRYIAITAN